MHIHHQFNTIYIGFVIQMTIFYILVANVFLSCSFPGEKKSPSNLNRGAPIQAILGVEFTER